MSSQTLTQVLSKLKHGTIIRHKEDFNDIKLLDYGPKCSLTGLTNVRIGNNSLGYLNKEEMKLIKPFVFYCILFKLKGKSGFYECDERGFFNINEQYETLSQFVITNFKSIWPNFNTITDCLNKLEYYCKETNKWILLSNCPIQKEKSGKGRPKSIVN